MRGVRGQQEAETVRVLTSGWTRGSHRAWRTQSRHGGFLRRAAAVAHERLAQAIVALDPVIVEAADVAHPVAVDVGVAAAA